LGFVACFAPHNKTGEAMRFGSLNFINATENPELLAEPTAKSIAANGLEGVLVSEIDGTLADTAKFCDVYEIGLDVSVNCVIVKAKKSDREWFAACLIRATDRADINGVVRRELNARKISFAPMEVATDLTGMAYGGITPIGLPQDWPLIVDESIAAIEKVIIGSGIRGSKLLVPGDIFSKLPNSTTIDLVKASG